MPEATCPAATLIEGPPARGPSALCGVMANERAQLGSGAERNAEHGPLVTSRDDPSSFHGFCCGAYRKCPIWRAEKGRIEAARARVTAPPVKPDIGMVAGDAPPIMEADAVGLSGG